MHILLTNDDGITAKGLSILEEVVASVADKDNVVRHHMPCRLIRICI